MDQAPSRQPKQEPHQSSVHTRRVPAALNDPMRKRGVAFTDTEREALGLVGRLPPGVLTLDQQPIRAYGQLQRQSSELAKNVHLERLHDRNEVLYYKVLGDHWSSCCRSCTTQRLARRSSATPTNTASRAAFSCRPTGRMTSPNAFGTLELGPGDVDLIVCTNAEEILGIGDWGVGGIQIAVGKLAVYSAAAGIDPRRVIPVSLDVGTDNEVLLNDPLYVGNRHARGPAYDAFIAKYLETASSLFPDAPLHFEDFGPGNARRRVRRPSEGPGVADR
jgi:malate dehydrogenase (oxaloacetate-decarboxylating)